MTEKLLIALITAIITVSPQIVSKVLDHKKEVKFKQMELFEKEQKQILVNFIDVVTSFIKCDNITNEQLCEYYKDSYKLLAFFPQIEQYDISVLGDFIKENDQSQIEIYFQRIISKLPKEQFDK